MVLKHLATLDLAGTPVNEEGLKEDAKLPGLTSLELSQTKMKGALKGLAGAKRLRCLRMQFAEVTDEDAKHLAGMKSLVELDLSYTEVTEAGARRLGEALPRCRIAQGWSKEGH